MEERLTGPRQRNVSAEGEAKGEQSSVHWWEKGPESEVWATGGLSNDQDQRL